MSANAILSIHTFTPTTETWSSVLDPIRQNPGVKSIYWGKALEDPEKNVVVTQWSSREALDAFASSDALAALAGVAAGGAVTAAHLSLEGTLETALDVPCTEFVTAYGVEPTFIGRCREFITKVDASHLEGYHGYAFGEVDQHIAKDAKGQKAPAVILIVGWDSKEAHIEAKAKPGPIGENIHLIRTAREDLGVVSIMQNLLIETVTYLTLSRSMST
ncbi:unnamed protein product [Parascedosporium putredinis]|uniref:ABM domain-containing protein n=1 Tax=Parascedosporium putredinis TaxID=1442378 RepID=A0A9P1H736_9PEZI|nr:unnamed protein product [Parascedosporium putredinis]CAI7998560.1 unnamed protein product [Parascedosporium putredinis]